MRNGSRPTSTPLFVLHAVALHLLATAAWTPSDWHGLWGGSIRSRAYESSTQQSRRRPLGSPSTPVIVIASPSIHRTSTNQPWRRRVRPPKAVPKHRDGLTITSGPALRSRWEKGGVQGPPASHWSQLREATHTDTLAGASLPSCRR